MTKCFQLNTDFLLSLARARKERDGAPLPEGLVDLGALTMGEIADSIEKTPGTARLEFVVKSVVVTPDENAHPSLPLATVYFRQHSGSDRQADTHLQPAV